MAKFTNTATGVVVSVADEKAYRFGADWTRDDDGVSDPGAYAGMKVDELKTEIERRNEGREEADVVSAAGHKSDLVAALEADDAK